MSHHGSARRATGAVIGAAVAVSVTGTVLAHDGAEFTDDLAHNKHLQHAGAQHGGGSDGHIPVNKNFGFTLVGETNLDGIIQDFYTDVWAHKGYAYVGTFQSPECTRAGVFVADISDPVAPETVGHIKSPPGTRINDVKVHEIGGKDYLFTTLEKCGPIVGNGTPQGNGNGGSQQGQGGVSIFDVTDPTKPHAVKRNLLDFQVHNTFPWTVESGPHAGSYLMVVDDENLDDVTIVDVSKPQSPKVIAQTGIGTWVNGGEAPQILADGQLLTGNFAFYGLHDIWVEEIEGVWTAVLSYWDPGFITLDVSDPHNPTFIKDSTYPAQDPVSGKVPMEGNAHAAVFGNAGDDGRSIIFAGDEDFDPQEIGVTVGSDFYPATTGSDTPFATLSGPTRYAGQGCANDVMPLAGDPTEIAVISRGTCAFTDKVTSATAAGYAAAIIMNQGDGGATGGRCAESVSMLVEGTIPAFFVGRPSGLAILGVPQDLDCDSSALTVGALGNAVSVGAAFDGWGYMYILDTATMDHIGYYAPAEVNDPAYAVGAGDLTMHNVEADPAMRSRAYVSWYSLGMRAVDHRPGHFHDGTGTGFGVYAENMHETGRYIDPRGSNIWGTTVYEHENGDTYILASDRNLGLQIFTFECEEKTDAEDAFYCSNPNGY